MLLMPLISATLKDVLKRLLYQDRTMSTASEHPKGKVLRFELAEWETSVILVFGERRVDVLNAWDAVADCTVRTRFATLPALLDMAEFDAAELLAPWVGDIVAEGVTKAVASRLTEARRLLHTGQGRVTQAITDEWRQAPSALELAWFCDEVDDITRAGKNLAARLDKLEASR